MSGVLDQVQRFVEGFPVSCVCALACARDSRHVRAHVHAHVEERQKCDSPHTLAQSLTAATLFGCSDHVRAVVAHDWVFIVFFY